MSKQIRATNFRFPIPRYITSREVNQSRSIAINQSVSRSLSHSNRNETSRVDSKTSKPSTQANKFTNASLVQTPSTFRHLNPTSNGTNSTKQLDSRKLSKLLRFDACAKSRRRVTQTQVTDGDQESRKRGEAENERVRVLENWRARDRVEDAKSVRV